MNQKSPLYIQSKEPYIRSKEPHVIPCVFTWTRRALYIFNLKSPPFDQKSPTSYSVFSHEAKEPSILCKEPYIRENNRRHVFRARGGKHTLQHTLLQIMPHALQHTHQHTLQQTLCTFSEPEVKKMRRPHCGLIVETFGSPICTIHTPRETSIR